MSGDEQLVASEVETVLGSMYRAFNRRDLDRVCAVLAPDVVWANGREGEFVHGTDEVRAYWERQFDKIDPDVEPVSFEVGTGGRVVVNVDELISDHDGVVVSHHRVHHLFTMTAGKVARFEILDSNGGADQENLVPTAPTVAAPVIAAEGPDPAATTSRTRSPSCFRFTWFRTMIFQI